MNETTTTTTTTKTTYFNMTYQKENIKMVPNIHSYIPFRDANILEEKKLNVID
jgi:hypothetical protein